MRKFILNALLFHSTSLTVRRLLS